ncbi:MAG: hypothetical protein QOH84_695 [Kribbellaceae bacterium]|nr:hypothetical protein [Kribbellaceae bacterium]
MSYDFAIWESDASTRKHSAATTFEELYDRYLSGELVAPTARIQAYSEALAAHFPGDESEDTPGQRVVRSAAAPARSCTSRSGTAMPTKSA